MNTPNKSDLWKNWQPPRELSQSTPRDVALTGNGIVMYVMAALFVLGGVGACVGFSIERKHTLATLKALDEEGVNVDGEVTRVYETGSKDREYRARYKFFANGQSFTGNSRINRARWRLLTVGGSIAVRYVASDPKRNYPVNDPPKPLPPWFPAVFGLFFAALGGLFFWFVSRDRHLLEEGKAAPGIVTSRRWAGHQGGKTQNIVSYEFSPGGGSIRKGRSHTTKRPAVGEGVTILYLPDHPRRNAIYPLCTVKVERS